MNWNVAQAKQHLSQVIREAAREPQLIHNRNRPVAAVIAAEDLAGYRAWKETQTLQPTRMLADEFAELRRILVEEGFENGLEIPPRAGPDNARPNAFVQMLEEEYPERAK
ncbi:MAG: type II toxin-antitoxin system prevent-host-death family antitoxin [Rhodocyclaceae bacterium]|nr:type II toxin-antitoxin system prevent-host-death family antitoxin [Rhodocyclaceae bacterium]